MESSPPSQVSLRRWSRAPLGEVADFINGRAFKPEDWVGAGVPIIRIQNLNGGAEFNLYAGEVEPRFAVRPGDLLFSWSGTRGTSFGPHIWNGPPGVLNQHIFNVRNLRAVEQRYLYYALELLTAAIAKRAHGGTGIVHITKGELEAFDIPTPPLPEQSKIAAVLSSVDEAIGATQAVMDQLQVVKKAMMAELLTRGLPGRHTRFKRTEIGDVPEEWDVVTLDSLIAAGRPICYGVLKPGPHDPGGVPVVRITDYRGDRLDVARVQRSNAAIVAPFMRSVLRTGDLLISIRGTAGRVCVVPEDIEGGNISRDSARISLGDTDLQSYVYCYLRSSVSQQFVFGEMRGLAIKGINIHDLRRLPVPIPPRAERQMICGTLLAIDAALRSNEEEVQALLRTKAALMSVLLTGEVRVTPDEVAA